MLLLLRIKTLETSFTSALVSSHTFCRLSKLEYFASKLLKICHLLQRLFDPKFLFAKDFFSLKIVCTYCKDLKFLYLKLVNFAFRFHAQICVCKHFIMQRFPQMFSNFQALLFIIRTLWNFFLTLHDFLIFHFFMK